MIIYVDKVYEWLTALKYHGLDFALGSLSAERDHKVAANDGHDK